MSLGGRIRAAREAAGYTREELAERIGVAPRTLSNWERDVVTPRTRLGVLERELGVHLRDGPADDNRVALDDATDAELVANLAGRLAERDRQIRELTQRVEQLELGNSNVVQPTRWASRSRGPEPGRPGQ